MILKMKTDNKVPLKIGYLTFFRDRLVISEGSNIEKIIILTGFFSTSLYGLFCVLSYNSFVEPVMYYSGITILITWALATPLLIKRTYKQVLYYNDIGRINMRKNVGGAYQAKFTLKKGKIRFVYFSRNRKYFDRFINQLNENHLKTEFHTISI